VSAQLVVIDMQHVFGDEASPWFAPRFAEVVPRIGDLLRAAPRATFTRFVAPDRPAGAWAEYYRQFPFALQPPDAPLYRLVDEFAAAAGPTVDATTFGKWGTELAERIGGDELVLCGVATDCCVLSTALAAADAGVAVRVVGDACAGSGDAAHEQALALMRLYAPLIDVTTTAAVLAAPAGFGRAGGAGSSPAGSD
jgi:nicotinamidase-related amidase